mgnify:CR=1 FL=1
MLGTRFEPGESPWTQPPQNRESTLDRRDMHHWTDANMNVWKWKFRFIEATVQFGEEELEKMRNCPINPRLVIEIWRQHGCRHDRVVPEEVTYHFLPGIQHRNCRFFYTPVSLMHEARWGGQENFAVPSFARATLAYHGTSLPEAAKIIIEGAPKAGVTSVANRSGICVFTEEYKPEALLYATHTLMPYNPEFAVSVCLLLCVYLTR